MVDIGKMKKAQFMLADIERLLEQAGVFRTSISTGASFDVFREDLAIDIARAKAGNLDDREL